MALDDFTIDWTGAKTYSVTPDDLLLVPESTWLTGAIAYLFAPFPVDTGLWQSDQMVNEFVKIPDGRWQSVPAGNIHYPDLMALALAAPIRSVDNPEPEKIIEVEIVTPPESIPSAPIDLERIAIEGEGSQFGTEIGVEVDTWAIGFVLPVDDVAKQPEEKTADAMDERTKITSKPNGIPWWVWAGGAALGIYVLTRK